MGSAGDAPSISVAPSLAGAWRRPLPHLNAAPGTRAICRLLSIWALRHIRRVDGIEHIRPERDPFILALNHSQRAEALIVPAFLIHQRDGRLIHFLADWSFLLEPLGLHIGAPLQPPRVGKRSDPVSVRAWHAEIMGAIARLSGKSWVPRR